jgi:hypothetical protein
MNSPLLASTKDLLRMKENLPFVILIFFPLFDWRIMIFLVSHNEMKKRIALIQIIDVLACK